MKIDHILLIRQYKLYKLGIPVKSKFLRIFELVDSKLSNLQPFKMPPVSPCNFEVLTFFMDSEGKEILQYNTENGYTFVRCKGFWEILENKHKIDYTPARKFLQSIIEEKFKLKVSVTMQAGDSMDITVENGYKRHLSNLETKL